MMAIMRLKPSRRTKRGLSLRASRLMALNTIQSLFGPTGGFVELCSCNALYTSSWVAPSALWPTRAEDHRLCDGVNCRSATTASSLSSRSLMAELSLLANSGAGYRSSMLVRTRCRYSSEAAVTVSHFLCSELTSEALALGSLVPPVFDMRSTPPSFCTTQCRWPGRRKSSE